MPEKLRLYHTNHYYTQYYLFTDTSKHSWSGVLVQYSEHEQENFTKSHISHPIK